MHFIDKDIVVLIGNEKSMVTEKFAKLKVNDILIIGEPGQKENYNSEIFQDTLYILKLVVVDNHARGVIAIDKLIGELVFVRTNNIFISDTSYKKLFNKTWDLKGICFNIVLLLTDIEDKVENIDIIDNKIRLLSYIDGIWLVNRKEVDLDCFVENDLLSDPQASSIFDSFLQSIRILPDVSKLHALDEQISKIIQKYSNSSEEEIKTALYLLNVIEDGFRRQALEVFSENVNIYELIWSFELKGKLIAAKILINNCLKR